jgi:hypothetical protein
VLDNPHHLTLSRRHSFSDENPHLPLTDRSAQCALMPMSAFAECGLLIVMVMRRARNCGLFRAVDINP